MQPIIIALIGAASLILSSLLSGGVGKARALKRIKDEAEAFTAIPEELVLERQLARTALAQSIWEYALARRKRPWRWTVLLDAYLALLFFTVGITFVYGDGLNRWADPWVGIWTGSSIDTTTRVVAGALALFAIYRMLQAIWKGLAIPVRRAKYEVDGLSDSLDWDEQLLALHAKKLSQYGSVEDLPLGPWKSSKPSLKEVAKWHFTPWTPYHDVIAEYGPKSDSDHEAQTPGGQGAPEPES